MKNLIIFVFGLGIGYGVYYFQGVLMAEEISANFESEMREYCEELNAWMR